VVETLSPCPLLQMHPSDQSPYPVAIPETPLRTLEFTQGMAANPTIGESVDAFRDLLKIRKSMAMWNQSSTGSASGASCCWTARKPTSPSVRTVIDVVSVTPHWRMARSTALIASGPPLRTKAKRVACPSPSSAFPAITSKFRSGRWYRFLTYPPSNPTINSLHGLFDEPVANTSADFCSRFPTFIVRLRTVPAVARADSGRSSPRKSATFPNGNSAAILAVRYRNSGVIGFLFVNSVEKLRDCDPAQAHPLSRRMRMLTYRKRIEE